MYIILHSFPLIVRSYSKKKIALLHAITYSFSMSIKVSFASCFLCWITDFVYKLFNVLFSCLASACASVKLRCMMSLFTIIFSYSLLMLLHNDVPLLFFSFFMFIYIDIFHWPGISSESNILFLKKRFVVFVLGLLHHTLRIHFSLHLGLHVYGFLMLLLLALLHTVFMSLLYYS